MVNMRGIGTMAGLVAITGITAAGGALATNALLGERRDGHGVGLPSIAGGLAVIGGLSSPMLLPGMGARGSMAAMGVAALGLGVIFGGMMSVSPDI